MLRYFTFDILRLSSIGRPLHLQQSSIWFCPLVVTLKVDEFLLTAMGVLAPGSAHAKPSARPPIEMSGNFPALGT